MAEFDAYRDRLLAIVKTGQTHDPDGLTLASGIFSRHFLDAKLALAHPDDRDLAGAAACAMAADEGIEWDAVGGMTMGADPLTHGVATVSRKPWFTIRKQPKGRGTNRSIEGLRLTSGMRIFLVDDIVTSGQSIHDAYGHVVETGAVVVFATTLVDRSGEGAEFFAERNVPYRPMLTFDDLGIPRAGTESAGQAPASV
jgi:orotate phosphoribosyltransferase